MTLGIASIGLAAIAGMLSILSLCVWPLVPVVMSSAATSGRSGPWFLALGLSTAFGLAGSVLVLLLLNLGLGPEVLRYLAASMLLIVAVLLLVPTAGAWVTLQLSRLTSRTAGGGAARSCSDGHCFFSRCSSSPGLTKFWKRSRFKFFRTGQSRSRWKHGMKR